MMGRGRMVEAAEGREGGGRERGGGEEAGRGGRQRGVPPKNRTKTEKKKQPVFCLFFVFSCFFAKKMKNGRTSSTFLKQKQKKNIQKT